MDRPSKTQSTLSVLIQGEDLVDKNTGKAIVGPKAST